MKQEIVRQTPVINPMFPNYVFVGVVKMGPYFVPVSRNRKLCKQEAKSKYIPHQGKRECARRRAKCHHS